MYTVRRDAYGFPGEVPHIDNGVTKVVSNTVQTSLHIPDVNYDHSLQKYHGTESDAQAILQAVTAKLQRNQDARFTPGRLVLVHRKDGSFRFETQSRLRAFLFTSRDEHERTAHVLSLLLEKALPGRGTDTHSLNNYLSGRKLNREPVQTADLLKHLESLTFRTARTMEFANPTPNNESPTASSQFVRGFNNSLETKRKDALDSK